MRTVPSRATQASQVPPVGALNLDHVASFVPDQGSCLEALRALGFAPAPFSLQYHRLAPGSALVPAGTGNHCVMLHSGYLEYLVPIADTPVALQLRSAIERYVGAHSIVFGTGDAEADHRRLLTQGFEPLAPIALQRDVDTPEGSATARFTVVRVPSGAMAEGRIQFCKHHTEQYVWQGRWLDHPNGAVALNSVIACVADPADAARRYARFTGIEAQFVANGQWRLPLHRGRVDFCSSEALHGRFGIRAPMLPWIAGCEVATNSLSAAVACCDRHGIRCERRGDSGVLAMAPTAVGGVVLFVAA